LSKPPFPYLFKIKKVYFITDDGLVGLLADIEKRKRLVECGLRALTECKEENKNV